MRNNLLTYSVFRRYPDRGHYSLLIREGKCLKQSRLLFFVLSSHSKEEHSVGPMELTTHHTNPHFHAVTDCMKKGNTVVIL